MGNKRTLNAKRLTKKQVQILIRSEARLHEEYTKVFEVIYTPEFTKRDLVYELPGDRFLYVFDEKDVLLPGKGDIYPKEYFERFVAWVKRVNANLLNKRGNSLDHWAFYSKNKLNFISRIDELVVELARKLTINIFELDKSYSSLNLISEILKEWDIITIFEELYDSLVAYIGEVIKQRVKGGWRLNSLDTDFDYPFISIIELKGIHYMPINVCWGVIGGIDAIDLRRGVINEIRSNISRVTFERMFL